MGTNFWILPHIPSILNALLTFTLCSIIVFGIFLKSGNTLSSKAIYPLQLILLASVVALLYAAHPVYKKVFDHSLISFQCLTATIICSFIAALITGGLYGLYRKASIQENSSCRWGAVAGILFVAVVSSFCLGGIRQKSFSRDLTLKIYSEITTLSLGGAGESAVLKKQPELLDYIFDYLFLQEPEKKMLEQQQFIERIRNVRTLIHKERIRYYKKAPDILLANQFSAFVSLAKVAIHKDRKNCSLLLMHDSVEHLSGRDREFNAALILLDEREEELIEKTDMEQPDVSFNRNDATGIIEKTLSQRKTDLESLTNQSTPQPEQNDIENGDEAFPSSSSEAGEPSREDVEKICMEEFSDLVKLAALPESERAQVARFIFIGEEEKR